MAAQFTVVGDVGGAVAATGDVANRGGGWRLVAWGVAPCVRGQVAGGEASLDGG